MRSDIVIVLPDTLPCGGATVCLLLFLLEREYQHLDKGL